MEKQFNKQINTTAEISGVEQKKEHHTHKKYHHSSRRRHSSRHHRRKQNGFIWYKIKHFFRKNRRQRNACRRNPNYVEQKVMVFWILAAVLLMVLLIPLFIWFSEHIMMTQSTL